jgi:DNA-binding NarL/FixJ family response regulator
MASDERAHPPVSEAQRRVLVALCRPYGEREFAIPASNRQIAQELMIGLETVKTHLRALSDAFGLSELPQHQKRAALAQRALETGLVTAHDIS